MRGASFCTGLRAAAVGVCLVVAAPSVARGEPPPASAPSDNTANAAMAQSLFEAGRELMDAQRYSEACKKFEESNRLDPSAGTLLNWGRCLELSGKTGSAWAMYKRTIVLGNATNKPRQVAAAQQYIEALEPRLSRLAVDIARPPKGLVVRAGEVELTEASAGVAVVVDPGTFDVRAEAPGFVPWSKTITVGEGRSEKLIVPALAPRARVEKASPLLSRPLVIGGIALSAIGVASLAVGAAFGGMALSDASEAETDPTLCPDHACSPEGEELIAGAKTKAGVSTGLLIGGAVVLATGATLFGVGVAQRPTENKQAFVAPWLGDTMGLLVRGTF